MSIGGWRAYLFSPSLLFDSFPLKCVWTLLSLVRRFFHRELLNHVSLPSPEFQMQAVEKLAIASAWQVGSISVLSPYKAWAFSRPLGTTADCALVRVRLLGQSSDVVDRRSSRSHSRDQSGSFDELTPEGAKWAVVGKLHLSLSQVWLTLVSLNARFLSSLLLHSLLLIHTLLNISYFCNVAFSETSHL